MFVPHPPRVHGEEAAGLALPGPCGAPRGGGRPGAGVHPPTPSGWPRAVSESRRGRRALRDPVMSARSVSRGRPRASARGSAEDAANSSRVRRGLGDARGRRGGGSRRHPWGSRCPAALACEDTSSLPPPGLWLLDPATLSPNSRTSGFVPLKQRLPPRVSVSRRCGAAVTGAELRGDSFLRETPALCPLPAFPDTCYESGVYLHVSVWE